MSKRIALTGGIACGKSLVAKYLNELGVGTIDADDVVHEILPDPAERKRIAAEVFADPEKRRALEARIHPLVKERIGRFFDCSISDCSISDCIDPFSHLDIDAENAKMAQCQNTIANRKIEKSKNPSSSIANRKIEKSKNIKLAIIPLLFETHWDADYDIICAVISPRETQVERMMTTRGYTREEAEARLAAQLPVAEKAAKSHYVINNDGTPDELRAKVRAFVGWLERQNHG